MYGGFMMNNTISITSSPSPSTSRLIITFEFLHDLLERIMRMFHIKVKVQRVQQHSLRYHHFLLESEELLFE
jgi:hypothetical protein